MSLRRRSQRPTGADSLDVPAVQIDAVTAGYGGLPVLTDATLDLQRGETVSLLGPSGCGKTTLLRSIAGLTQIASGTVSISGKVVSGPGVHLAPERRHVGMVFQDGALFPHLTVQENILFGLRHHESGESRLSDVLELTALGDLKDRLPGTLSGGQQQRVALARALAPRPRVLLLDEPFSALDAGLRVQLRREVRDILHEVGISSIVVTHDQDEAFAIGDRVGVMNKGHLLQVGSPADLYERPATPWVAGFVGEANELVGQMSNGRVMTPIGELPVSLDAPDGSSVRVVIRPEQLAMVSGNSSVVNSLEYFGHDARYEITHESVKLGVRTSTAHFEPGERVDLKFVGGIVPAWIA